MNNIDELTIDSELFNKDLDDLEFVPETSKSDNDEDAKELFGY